MTKEEANILYEQSHAGTLRKPNCMLCDDTKTIDSMITALLSLIYFKNQNNLSRFEKFKQLLTCKQILKSNEFVEKLKGHGTASKPYHLTTIFGDGDYLDLHTTYETGKLPSFIKKFYCFSNCMSYAIGLAHQDIESAVLTGIACFKGPFLHSVLLVKHDDQPQIFDFNYDLVMDRDLYLKLFSFEVLSKVSGQQLLDVKDLIQAGPKVKDYQLLLAFDDCIKFKREALAQEQSKEASPIHQNTQEKTILHTNGNQAKSTTKEKN